MNLEVEMNLEEVRKLSDLELEYEIHKLISDDIELVNPDGNRFLIGRNYHHQFSHFPKAKGDEPIDWAADAYEYARKLDKVAEVEKIVVEKVGKTNYREALHQIVDRYDFIACVMATARQRAEALWLVLQGEK